MKEMRLDRFLAEMGQGSRSQVKDMVRKGRVLVNGEPEKRAERKVCPDRDQVAFDGRLVGYAGQEYIMLHKPAGLVSATRDRSCRTVMDLVDSRRRDLFPVGRLDLDTEGLLLLTNDGDLAHRLLSPKKHVDKVYVAHVRGPLADGWERRFGEGLCLEDGVRLMPATAWALSFGPDGVCSLKSGGAAPVPGLEKALAGLCLLRPKVGEEAVALCIREGKFHQVKRMFEAVGGRVVYLKRLAMGPLWLDARLRPGESRPLSGEEVMLLDGYRQEGNRNGFADGYPDGCFGGCSERYTDGDTEKGEE